MRFRAITSATSSFAESHFNLFVDEETLKHSGIHASLLASVGEECPIAMRKFPFPRMHGPSQNLCISSM